jgi:hypothetical protein
VPNKYEASWHPENPRLPPGEEKSYWIDRVRVKGSEWKRFQQAYREAKRTDDGMTWSKFVREALERFADEWLR